MVTEGNEQDIADGLVPEFTVWIVRHTETHPMVIDTIWMVEALARKRAALLDEPWEAQRYQHLKCESRSPDGDGLGKGDAGSTPVRSIGAGSSVGREPLQDASEMLSEAHGAAPRTRAWSEPADSLPSLVLQGITTRCAQRQKILDDNVSTAGLRDRLRESVDDINALVALCEQQEKLIERIRTSCVAINARRLLAEMHEETLTAQVAQQATEIRTLQSNNGKLLMDYANRVTESDNYEREAHRLKREVYQLTAQVDAHQQEQGKSQKRDEIVATVDGRCGCARCTSRTEDIYRMIGVCVNCGAKPILMLFRAGDPSADQDCPVCGGYHKVTAQRLATADELPSPPRASSGTQETL